jgi:hypothetical protein
MIKKQPKWIACFVICAFAWLMHVSAMPAVATESTGPASAIGSDQGPDYLDAVGQKAAPAKKKSILPWILIGAGVLTVTAVVLFLFVLKGYDIIGTWSGLCTINGSSATFTGKAVFSGSKKSGTVLFTDPGVVNAPGTYTVNGKNLSFTFEANGSTVTFTGTFSDKDAMGGTWVNLDAVDWGGTWNFTRTAAAAQPPAIQSLGRGNSVIKNQE